MAFKEIADAFKELAVIVDTPGLKMPVKQFSDACSRFFLIFNVLETGMFPRFAEIDYVSKVKDLAEVSSSVSTIEEMVDKDIEANCVRKVGSHTRNLLRVKRGLEMIRVLSEELLDTESDNSLRDAAFTAYNKVFAPHHGFAIQQAAATGMESLLSKALLFKMFNETEETVKIHSQTYVTASATVTTYLDNLFLSKNIGIDW